VNHVLHWHPKFNVFNLANQDLLLISETDSFNLPNRQFPSLNLIDGQKTLSQILMALNLSAEQSYGLLRNIRMLVNEGILLEENQGQTGQPEHCGCYLNQTRQTGQVVARQGDFCLINASLAAETRLAAWKTVFAGVIQCLPAQTGLCLILLDSFLDVTLPAMLDDKAGEGQHLCLIRVVEQKIWLLHVPPTADMATYLTALQKRLLDNAPAHGLAKKLFPDDNRCIPFLAEHALALPDVEKISAQVSDIIRAQVSSNEASLRIWDSVSGAVELHPIVLAQADDQAFARQIQAPLRLNPCPQAFHADGGSRSIAPAQTLEKLQPFISPITGVITHLHMLKGTEQHSIKIFSSAFFKTPAVKANTDLAALAETGFVQRCLGKGVSAQQSQASALCEAIERYSALYQGDEPGMVARASDLKSRYCDFQQLVPYSASQYQRFADPNHPDARQKQAAQRYEDQAIHWVSAWSLSGNEAVWLPLSSCFSNIPFEDDRFGRWHSNGCAAGNTLEEAILQGLFELIERDATAIWWYNRIRRPAFDMSLIPAEHMRLLDATLSPEHEYWVLDLTNDIGVPVMAAIGRHKHSAAISFGFGCHVQAELAAQRALTELCQLIPIRDQGSAQFDFNAIQAQDYLLPSGLATASATGVASTPCTPIAPGSDIKATIEALVARLHALGLETIALNYSRQPLPIKTAKVWVPGLAHIWPQYANCRLYQVPLTMGWLAEANTEAGLNPQALFI
jgi:oxazoline/thiazoline synthase